LFPGLLAIAALLSGRFSVEAAEGKAQPAREIPKIVKLDIFPA
jgi:hypothetical protein